METNRLAVGSPLPAPGGRLWACGVTVTPSGQRRYCSRAGRRGALRPHLSPWGIGTTVLRPPPSVSRSQPRVREHREKRQEPAIMSHVG